MDKKRLAFRSKLVHGAHFDDPLGSATVPIYQTSTFAFLNAANGADRFAGKADGYIYTRIGNPTIAALEGQVADLENGWGGIATASGMGAVASIYMALLEQGEHLVGTASVYGPSRTLVEKYLSRFGVESTYVDTSDIDNIRRAIRPATRIVYVESPSNPAMLVTDLEQAAEVAHEHGALLVVDNTFASPYLQRPLDLGADVVFHSVTKFINGHADVVGGIIARRRGVYRRIRRSWVNLGCNMTHPGFSGAEGPSRPWR